LRSTFEREKKSENEKKTEKSDLYCLLRSTFEREKKSENEKKLRKVIYIAC